MLNSTNTEETFWAIKKIKHPKLVKHLGSLKFKPYTFWLKKELVLVSNGNVKIWLMLTCSKGAEEEKGGAESKNPAKDTFVKFNISDGYFPWQE